VILRNGCYRLWRREDRGRRRAAGPEIDLAEYVCPGSTTPDKVAEQSELTCLARQFIVDLPPRMREVMQLAVFAEAPDAEIAGLLGIPIGTVKSRKNRAMAFLRARLGRAVGE
jgi:RNA polymerase sigma factor (sigma-70 family)